MSDAPKPYIPRMSHLAFPLGVCVAFILGAIASLFIEGDFEHISVLQIIIAFGLLMSSLFGLAYSLTAYYLHRWPTAKFSMVAGFVIAAAFLGVLSKTQMDISFYMGLVCFALSALAALLVKRRMPASADEEA